MTRGARGLGWMAVLGGLGLAPAPGRAEGSRVKPLAIPKDRASWEETRASIRRTVEDLLGDLPPRPEAPVMDPLRREMLEGIRVEHVRVHDGTRPAVRAIWVLPTHATADLRVPAVVFVGDPSQRVEPLRPGPDGQPPALTMARRGFAVLWLEPGPIVPWTENDASPGRATAWGMALRDDRIALDALLARPEIDRGRVGVAGVGWGGTHAWWLMALDERVACGVFVGGLTRIGDWRGPEGSGAPPLTPWVAKMLESFDTEAIIALCSPRPVELLAGDRDPSSPVAGLEVFETTGQRIDVLHGTPGNFHLTLYGRLGRRFSLLEWGAILEMLDKWLMPQGPTPLRHVSEPEPVVDDRFVDPAAHGLAGWVAEMSQRPTTWTWRDGTIVCRPGPDEFGWLRAPIEVDDFILQLEWKVPEGGNSGLFFRARPVGWSIPPSKQGKRRVETLGLDWPSRTGLELQAQDDAGHADKYSSGALYRHAAPAANPTRPAGQWNRYTVRCQGLRVEVWCNGQQVLDTRLDHLPTLRQPPLQGYFGLQNHGVDAEFRNIRLLRLGPGASRRCGG
ncbi:MAG: DUF1080 domain-containing protein [Singulisphaera sp.]|nr:DUF1080 domain-containing protein [Singulisphaera sp.]